MAKKASENFKRYQNPNGPDITTVIRPIIEMNGLHFKDIDGSGTVSEVNDWRLPAQQRARAYVKQMTVDEKIGQLFISDWRMGPKYPSPRLKGHVAIPDESGIVDDLCRPMKETHLETTLAGTRRIAEIAADVHANGGKVVANINFPLAWLEGNVESYADSKRCKR